VEHAAAEDEGAALRGYILNALHHLHMRQAWVGEHCSLKAPPTAPTSIAVFALHDRRKLDETMVIRGRDFAVVGFVLVPVAEHSKVRRGSARSRARMLGLCLRAHTPVLCVTISQHPDLWGGRDPFRACLSCVPAGQGTTKISQTYFKSSTLRMQRKSTSSFRAAHDLD